MLQITLILIIVLYLLSFRLNSLSYLIQNEDLAL